MDFVALLDSFIEENMTYHIDASELDLEEVESIIIGFRDNYICHRLVLRIVQDIEKDVLDLNKRISREEITII
jgi:hypothetical protein